MWHSVLADLIDIKGTVYSDEEIENMSADALRMASLRIVQVDWAFTSSTLPHHKTTILLNEDLGRFADINLLPGGERLLALGMDGSLTMFSLRTEAVITTISGRDDRFAGTRQHPKTFRLYPTSLLCGFIVVHCLGEHRPT